MSILQTRALVLHTYPYGESSLVAHLYTEKQGRVAILAKGARKIKSPFRSYIEPFTLLDIIYYYKPTRDLQILSKVEKITRWEVPPANWEFVCHGSVILEILDKLTSAGSDENLFLTTITTLDYMVQHPDFLPSALIKFLLHSAEICGYRLDLWSCASCHQPLEQAFYDHHQAVLVCAACCPTNLKVFALTAEMLAYLRQLWQFPWERDLLTCNPEIAFRLTKMLTHYLGFHHDLDLKLKSLDLLAKIRNDLTGGKK